MFAEMVRRKYSGNILRLYQQNVYPGGDHSILTGLVEHREQAKLSAQPLLYYAQTYGTFAALPQPGEPARPAKKMETNV